MEFFFGMMERVVGSEVGQDSYDEVCRAWLVRVRAGRPSASRLAEGCPLSLHATKTGVG